MIDYRLPEHRRETFLKFYGFHLKYASHPGGVYYLMPWLAKHYDWNMEDRLWFAYLNGNTQNPITSWLIWRQFPNSTQFFVMGGREWFDKNWSRLQWDTDRRYQKKDFPSNVEWYEAECLNGGGGQRTLFSKIWEGEQTDYARFDRLWLAVRNFFPTFGRLSAFSYLEYLRIMGLPQDCSSLFLDDISGSKSHRNGLSIVLGRDDLDWHGKEPVKYDKETIHWLTLEGQRLLQDAKDRWSHLSYPWVRDISYYTLESALCTYKSWHRRNRRYPNVYNDMMHDRIMWAQKNWPEVDLTLFWQAREECLPEYLRMECNPNDPGLVPEKQNFYLDNGIPIMMSKDYPEFDNAFDRKVWA